MKFMTPTTCVSVKDVALFRLEEGRGTKHMWSGDFKMLLSFKIATIRFSVCSDHYLFLASVYEFCFASASFYFSFFSFVFTLRLQLNRARYSHPCYFLTHPISLNLRMNRYM